MKADERAKKVYSFPFNTQRNTRVTVEDFLRTAKTSVTGKMQGIMAFKKLLKEKMDLLEMKRNMLLDT